MGARAVRAADRALDRVPDRRGRADRHAVPARPRDLGLLGRHRPAPGRDLRPDRAAARPLPRPPARAPLAGRAAGAAARRQAWAEPVHELGREPPALLPHPQGAAAHPPPGRARRVDHGAAPRPVGEPHRHPQDRDRPRPRRDREAQPAGGVDRGGGLGLRPRGGRPDPPALRQGLHLDRLRAVHARDRARRGVARGPLVVGDERAEGVRDPLRDRDRRDGARAARDPRGGSHDDDA